MGVLDAACGICFPVQRLNPGPLHCQCRDLATGKFPGILLVCFVSPGLAWGGGCLCVAFFFAKVEKRKDYVNKCGTGNELTFWLYFQRTYSL